MKHKLFFFLLFINSILTFAQTQKIRNGKYYPILKDAGFENNLFVLDDGKLEFTLFHCGGWNYGEGNYKIENDQLFLKFTNIKSPKDNYRIDNQVIGYSDSLTLDFKIVDQYKESYAYAGVSIFCDSLKIVKMSDNYGKTQLKIPKIHLPLTLKVLSLGYTTTEIQLEVSQKKFDSQTYTVVMRGGERNFYNSNDELKYKVRSTHKNGFTLEISPNYQVYYEKIKRKKYRALLKEREEWGN